MKCVVSSCTNTKRFRRPGITFHRFPKNEILRRKWLEAIGKPNFQPNYNSYVCSEHFLAENISQSTDHRTKLWLEAIPQLKINQNLNIELKECIEGIKTEVIIEDDFISNTMDKEQLDALNFKDSLDIQPSEDYNVELIEGESVINMVFAESCSNEQNAYIGAFKDHRVEIYFHNKKLPKDQTARLVELVGDYYGILFIPEAGISKDHKHQIWEEIASELNEIGPSQTAELWRNTFRSIRYRTIRKLANLRKYHQGKDFSGSIVLSSQDKNICKMMGETDINELEEVPGYMLQRSFLSSPPASSTITSVKVEVTTDSDDDHLMQTFSTTKETSSTFNEAPGEINRQQNSVDIKITDEQIIIYLKYLENCEPLRTGVLPDNVPLNYLAFILKELKTKLNDCRTGPQLSCTEWKTRFEDFRNSVFMKSQKIQEYKNKTGQMENIPIFLNQLEQRALHIWTKDTVNGTAKCKIDAQPDYQYAKSEYTKPKILRNKNDRNARRLIKIKQAKLKFEVAVFKHQHPEFYFDDAIMEFSDSE